MYKHILYCVPDFWIKIQKINLLSSKVFLRQGYLRGPGRLLNERQMAVLSYRGTPPKAHHDHESKERPEKWREDMTGPLRC